MKRLLFILLLLGIVANTWASNNPTTKTAIPTFAIALSSADNDTLFADKNISISGIYPNPATDFIGFRYVMTNPNTVARIIIRNVLGSVVAEQILSPNERLVRISVENFVSGVYFYTLSVNDKNINTKKFLIRN